MDRRTDGRTAHDSAYAERRVAKIDKRPVAQILRSCTILTCILTGVPSIANLTPRSTPGAATCHIYCRCPRAIALLKFS